MLDEQELGAEICRSCSNALTDAQQIKDGHCRDCYDGARGASNV